MLRILLPSAMILGIVVCHIAANPKFSLDKILIGAVIIISIIYALSGYDENGLRCKS